MPRSECAKPRGSGSPGGQGRQGVATQLQEAAVQPGRRVCFPRGQRRGRERGRPCTRYLPEAHPELQLPQTVGDKLEGRQRVAPPLPETGMFPAQRCMCQLPKCWGEKGVGRKGRGSSGKGLGGGLVWLGFPSVGLRGPELGHVSAPPSSSTRGSQAPGRGTTGVLCLGTQWAGLPRSTQGLRAVGTLGRAEPPPSVCGERGSRMRACWGTFHRKMEESGELGPPARGQEQGGQSPAAPEG